MRGETDFNNITFIKKNLKCDKNIKFSFVVCNICSCNRKIFETKIDESLAFYSFLVQLR